MNADREDPSEDFVEANQISFFNGPPGQGLLEYALILLLVVLAVIAVIYLLGPEIGNLYSNVISNIP